MAAENPMRIASLGTAAGVVGSGKGLLAAAANFSLTCHCSRMSATEKLKAGQAPHAAISFGKLKVITPASLALASKWSAERGKLFQS